MINESHEVTVVGKQPVYQISTCNPNEVLVPISKSARMVLAYLHSPILHECFVSTKYQGYWDWQSKCVAHTSYLYIPITRNRYSNIRFHNSVVTFSSPYALRNKKEKRTLQRDKGRSECSNINMTSPILSLQYTLWLQYKNLLWPSGATPGMRPKLCNSFSK